MAAATVYSNSDLEQVSNNYIHVTVCSSNISL